MSLYRRAHSPHWWCRFQLDGREVRLSTRTENRRQAEEFETLARVRAYRQIRLGERPPYPWSEATRRWLADTRKRSKDIDERIIAWFDEQFDADTTVQQITDEVIAELRALRVAESSESTTDRYMALLRAILKKCAGDWKIMDAAPKVPMYSPEKGEPRWMTPAEYARLEKHLPPHLKLLARFAVLTGLRMRAELSLTWRHVDMKAGRAWVARRSMKGKKTLGIPLSRDAVAVLRKAEARKREDCEFIFHWNGKRADDCNGHAFKDAAKAAGMPELRWHDLRHTFASWAVQSGVTLYELMQLGGWSSLDSVQIYAHLAPDHLKQAASKIRIRVSTSRKKSARKRNSNRNLSAEGFSAPMASVSGRKS